MSLEPLKRLAKRLLERLRIKVPKSGDPIFYLGVFAIFLFGLVCFVPGSSSGAVFLASASQSLLNHSIYSGEQQALTQNLFLDRTDVLPPESPAYLIAQGMGLLAVSPPSTVNPKILGSVLGSESGETFKNEIIEYVVEPGDSLSSLAEKFGVSADSIRWANNLAKGAAVKNGQKLVIPPVSGIIHYVKNGETTSDIAAKYKARADAIIDFNGLSSLGDIAIGDILVVPDGVMPAAAAAKPSPAPVLTPLASSYFIFPIGSPARRTQGLHYYNAVDFSHGQCGEPIYAAAGGVVLKVRLTSSTSRSAYGGAGNHITILHPNGVVSFYGHLNSAAVSEGQTVLQGQIIGFMGGMPGTAGAGRSTGCHLHFAVLGAQNPFR